MSNPSESDSSSAEYSDVCLIKGFMLPRLCAASPSQRPVANRLSSFSDGGCEDSLAGCDDGRVVVVIEVFSGLDPYSVL